MGLMASKAALFKGSVKALANNYFLLFMTTEADLIFCVFKQGLIRGGMGVMTLITFPLHHW